MSYDISFPGLGWDFSISRVAFSIGDFNIYWYGVIITSGLIIAFIYLFKYTKIFGIDADRMIDVLIGGLIGAIIGARLYYVIFNWAYFKDDLLSIFSTRGGGMAIYGGIIGAFVAGGFMCKWRKVKILPMFDIAGIGFLIGQALGRWGNFFNIEAYGSNTGMPWGMTSTKIQHELAMQASELAKIGVTVDPSQPVHPLFFYEFLWCTIGFLALHFYSRHRRFDGEIFLMYLGWYGFGRFWIEGLRTDSLMLGSIRVSQLLSAVLVIASVSLILYFRRKIKASPEERITLYANSPDWQAYLNKKDTQHAQKVPKENVEGQINEIDAAQKDESDNIAEGDGDEYKTVSEQEEVIEDEYED